jgi:hypothetical protein
MPDSFSYPTTWPASEEELQELDDLAVLEILAESGCSRSNQELQHWIFLNEVEPYYLRRFTWERLERLRGREVLPERPLLTWTEDLAGLVELVQRKVWAGPREEQPLDSFRPTSDPTLLVRGQVLPARREGYLLVELEADLLGYLWLILLRETEPRFFDKVRRINQAPLRYGTAWAERVFFSLQDRSPRLVYLAETFRSQPDVVDTLQRTIFHRFKHPVERMNHLLQRFLDNKGRVFTQFDWFSHACML